MYCIYEIKNLINNKTYIGQHKTNNLNDYYMGSGLLIKKSIEKYGIENFKKNILAITETKENVNILEKVFIKLYREEGKAEYNIASGGEGGNTYDFLDDERKKEISLKISESNKGKTHSEEHKRKCSESLKYSEKFHKIMSSKDHREKLSKSHKDYHWYNNGEEESMMKNCSEGFTTGRLYNCSGRILSEETKRKIGESNKGKVHSEETKRKISESNKGENNGFYGKHHSEESKRKISENNKGRVCKFTEEHKRKIGESLKGHKVSEETKRKISESNKGKNAWNKGVPHTEETRKKCGLHNIGKKHTEEWKINHSKSLKGHKISEETREKMKLARKLYWDKKKLK